MTEQHEGDLYVVGSDCKLADYVSDKLQGYVPVSRILVVYATRRIDNEVQIKETFCNNRRDINVAVLLFD